MADKSIIRAAVATVITLAVGSTMLTSPAAAQSLTDRFKGLFGGKADEPAQQQPGAPGAAPDPTDGLSCPSVAIRAGASTYAVGVPGKEPVGPDLRFQATITKLARECSINGGEITARIGIQGRVIAGPAGSPQTVQVPVRVAVVQGGVGERTIATKAYQTTVTMTETGSEPFTLVIEDLVYPAPSVAVSDSYIFYVGFDPQALKPETKPKATKKR